MKVKRIILLHYSTDLSAVELDVYRKLARVYLGFSDANMAKALGEGEVEEVDYDGKEVSE